LQQHWERGRVEAELTADGIRARRRGHRPDVHDPARPEPVRPEGRAEGYSRRPGGAHAAPLSDRSLEASYRKNEVNWELVTSAEPGLRKQHGLQGPIDDAFMDSFLMVKPTGKPMNEKVGAWVEKELAHAINHWRAQFRGDARVKTDEAVNDGDIARTTSSCGRSVEQQGAGEDRGPLAHRWTDKECRSATRPIPPRRTFPF
jgi:hypothetical protein